MRTVTTPLSEDMKRHWMLAAIEEAKKAESINEVPIGAVIVYRGEIIGRGFNQRESTQVSTTHAEVLAIQEACKKIGSWRLDETQLFVTLEPCPMCSGAILLSRIPDVYFSTHDPKGGTSGSLMNLLDDDRFNHTCYVEEGTLQTECSNMLSAFFKKLRKEKKACSNEE